MAVYKKYYFGTEALLKSGARTDLEEQVLGRFAVALGFRVCACDVVGVYSVLDVDDGDCVGAGTDFCSTDNDIMI